MKNIRRILAPTDFSDSAVRALTEAVELAKAEGAELLLVYVMQESDFPTGQVMRSRGFPDLREEVRKGGKRHLEDQAEKQVAGAVKCQTILREGVPSAEIAAVAEENDVDLIVVATHGHTGFKRFLLGSTTERLVRIAPCSVLIVRDRAAKK